MSSPKVKYSQEEANEEALRKLRAIKGSEEDEEALKKIRWTEEERRENESQIKAQAGVKGNG